MSSDRLDLPFGPLTREGFDALSLSYYDASFVYGRQAQARERGVNSRDYLRVRFAEIATRAAVEPTPHDVSDLESSPAITK
jgi:hypothetical protein